MADGLAVFPIQACYGSQGKQDWPRIFEEYDDGNWREYKTGPIAENAPPPKNHRMLSYEDLSEAELDAILDFHTARMRPGGDSQFFIYDVKGSNFEANADGVDLSGMDTQGRHTAIFLESEVTWTVDGPCTFSASVSVKLLD